MSEGKLSLYFIHEPTTYSLGSYTCEALGE